MNESSNLLQDSSEARKKPPLPKNNRLSPAFVKEFSNTPFVCEPVWPSGKELGWQAEGPRSDPLGLSSLFKTCGLWTLSCDFAHTINETLKCLAQLLAFVQSQSGDDSVTSRC